MNKRPEDQPQTTPSNRPPQPAQTNNQEKPEPSQKPVASPDKDSGSIYRVKKNKGSSNGGSSAKAAASTQSTPFDVNSLSEKEIESLRRSLKRYVKGKPTRRFNPVSAPAMILQGFTQFVKIICLLLAAAIFLTGGIGIGTVFGYVATTKPLPADLLKSGTQTSYVYDIKGDIMAKFTGAENIDRVYIPYNTVRDTYIDDAFIAIEDERFETNIGIDPKRILSAVVSALANSGEATHGGSTITQQTVKLITGDDQRSAQRKVQEWYKAVMLNQQLTKWEIMELYLNLVPMANSYVGIETASRAYFGKSASELTLPECAYLAGGPKSPSTYNPWTESGRRNGMRRQRIVLNKMYEIGKISLAEYRDALETELVFKKDTTPSAATQINSYFTEYAVSMAIKDMQERNDYSEELARQIITGGGVKIYTTMEPHVQEALDQTFQKQELFAADFSRVVNMPELPEAGMAVINNKTGAIAGMQGGYGDKQSNLVLNRATDIQRQPGSVTKPINVYAPAMEMYKVTGATILDDKKVFLDPENPEEPYPKNAYYPQYRGKMTLRNALKISNNVPAAEVMLMIGVDSSKYFMQKVGIDRTDDSASIAMAMGGYETGMSPLEIASAFTVFPTGGLYTPHYSYTKVVDSQGNILLENNPSYEQVYRPGVAYMMTKVMEETVKGKTSNFPYEGSAAGYGMLTNAVGETIATSGKTGTTDEDVDKWFCAFTPYYTGAVWYGFDNRIKKQSVIGPDNEGAKRIWFDAMRVIHAGEPPANWTQPADIVELKICIHSGKLASYSCGSGNAVSEYFEKNSPLTPQSVCPIHGGRPITPFGAAKTTPVVTESTTTGAQTSPTSASENPPSNGVQPPTTIATGPDQVVPSEQQLPAEPTNQPVEGQPIMPSTEPLP